MRVMDTWTRWKVAEDLPGRTRRSGGAAQRHQDVVTAVTDTRHRNGEGVQTAQGHCAMLVVFVSVL